MLIQEVRLNGLGISAWDFNPMLFYNSGKVVIS